MILQSTRPFRRMAIVVFALFTLSACNVLTRLSEVGDGPKISEIANPIKRPQYRPVSMPMPAPREISYKANSLWRPGARAFFRDQRANEVGDILTVKLSIADRAALDNKTTRERDDKEDGDLTKLFGLEAEYAKLLPQAIAAAALVSLGTKHETTGDGDIERSEPSP